MTSQLATIDHIVVLRPKAKRQWKLLELFLFLVYISYCFIELNTATASCTVHIVTLTSHFHRKDYRYWDRVGRADILKSLEANEKLNKNLAKNVIIFVGDGMSLPTLTASRIYQAQYSAKMQKKKVNGEESLLFFETFPHLGLSKVKQLYIS